MDFHTCAVKPIVQYNGECIEWYFCGLLPTLKPENVVHHEVKQTAIKGFRKLQKRRYENNKTTVTHNLQWTEAYIITPITEHCRVMRERNLTLAFIRRDVGRMRRWVWHSVVWSQKQPFTVHCNGNIWSEHWHCTKMFSASTLHLTETASSLRQTRCLLDDRKTNTAQPVYGFTLHCQQGES